MGILELIGVALAAVAGAFLYGKRSGKKDEQRKQDEAYNDTRKRMDQIDIPDDSGILRDIMRYRGQSKGDL